MLIFFLSMEIIVSVATVAIAMSFVVWLFLHTEMQKRQSDFRLKAIEDVLPNRLQAYERMALYLERISPEAMVLREQLSVSSGKELHTLLVNNVRQELEHNVAMQIYVTETSWKRILKARDEVIKTLNEAGKGLKPNCSSIEYGVEVIEYAKNNCNFYLDRAKDGLRKDLSGEFVNL